MTQMQPTEAPSREASHHPSLVILGQTNGLPRSFAQRSCPHGLKSPIETAAAVVTPLSVRRDDERMTYFGESCSKWYGQPCERHRSCSVTSQMTVLTSATMYGKLRKKRSSSWPMITGRWIKKRDGNTTCNSSIEPQGKDTWGEAGATV